MKSGKWEVRLLPDFDFIVNIREPLRGSADRVPRQTAPTSAEMCRLAAKTPEVDLFIPRPTSQLSWFTLARPFGRGGYSVVIPAQAGMTTDLT